MAGIHWTARLLASLSLGAITAAASAVPAQAQSATRSYDIPAQPLGSAIIAFSRQSDTVVTAPAALVRGKQARALRGSFTTAAALRRLLDGTGLSFRASAGGGYVVEAAGQPSQQSTAATSDDAESDGDEQGEITVTGTRIRGAQPSSPVVLVSREDMKRQGHNTLGEAIRALPQNFAGGQNPEIGIGNATAGGSANQNLTGGSTLNLRGLGPGATLTLLNGARLPYDGLFQATDIASIPAAAVERIEVLLDGASAVYGSDAVGGVANVILRRDYSGAEVSARYGFATEGGYEQQQYTLVAGTTWGEGGFIVTGEYSKNDPIRARQRDYLAGLPNQDVTILPDSDQKGGLFSGHQRFGSVSLTLDAFYSERTQAMLLESTTRQQDFRKSKNWGVAPAIGVEFGASWSAKLSGFLGANDTHVDQSRYLVGTDILAARTLSCYCNDARSVALEAEGPLFALPGGAARVALGGGYRYNRLDYQDSLALIALDGSRHSKFAFAELSLPLVGPALDVPFVSRLSLNGALRYEDYSDFGDIVTPKAGIIFSPVAGFDLKASWGRSFKAPTLQEQYSPSLAVLLPSAIVPGLPPTGTYLNLGGGNPNLSAERAETWSAGVALTPAQIPGLSIEFGWFRVDYRDRVANPIETAGLLIFSDPAYAQFALLNPTLAQQQAVFAQAGLPFGQLYLNATGSPYDPATVVGLSNGLFANVARQEATGIDASIRYQFALAGGMLDLNASGTWLDGSRQLTATAPIQATTGRLYFPAEFKGRAGASWSGGGLLLAANLDHVGGVRDTNLAGLPMGDSFTTMDLVIGYSAETGPLGGFEARLGVSNLFDTKPPLFATPQAFIPPYDPANYSAIGRVVNFTLTKRF